MFLNHDFEARRRLLTRRWFFKECSVGLGAMALGSLLGENKARAAIDPAGHNPLAPRQPHFQGKAKSVIQIVLPGGQETVCNGANRHGAPCTLVRFGDPGLTAQKCDDALTSMCCGDGICGGPETHDNCAADCEEGEVALPPSGLPRLAPARA